MATLKDHIRAVVKTRTTPSEASNASSIGSTLIEVSVPDYVASSDGYVNAYFHAASVPGAFGVLTNHGAQISSTQLASAASVNLQATLPVSKGQAINVYQTGFEKVKLYFIKTIGGGYKRYLPTLSRNRFGGALWLRLKTTSETLPRLGVASRSRVGKLLISNLSVRPRGMGSELTSHLRTGILPYLLMQRPMLLPKPILAMPASSCHRILQRIGLDALSLVGRGKSVNTPCTVKGSFKERRCSFIPRVACNNARMEVAA